MWYANRLAGRLGRVVLRGALMSALAVLISSYTAYGQSPADSSTAGRVAFDIPDVPPATVEIDLGKGLIRHAVGLGDAAVAGFLEGLTSSPDSQSSENVQFLAQQLTSARELGDVVSEVVQEIHVRVWDNLPAESQLAERAVAHFDTTLVGAGWEPALRVQERNNLVRAYVHRQGESISGVLFIAGEGNDVVLANVIGDLSPEKVHKLTSTATEIAVTLGLDKEINRAVEQLKREMQRAHD